MISDASEAAIDQIVASCNGDIRGALKALLLVNEHLEAELAQFYAAVGSMARPAAQRGTAVALLARNCPSRRVGLVLVGSLVSGQAPMVERASLASSSDL